VQREYGYLRLDSGEVIYLGEPKLGVMAEAFDHARSLQTNQKGRIREEQLQRRKRWNPVIEQFDLALPAD